MTPLAPGQVSFRLYPHALPVRDCVAALLEQARLAERAGFDGIMTAEHHGGFPGYVPQPLQLAGWCLDVTERIWAAPCPLLLPLQHWSHVAEQIAWLAARFPGRVAVGFAIGGLAQDFELADLDFEKALPDFKRALPRVAEALRGEAPEPLGLDPALAACRADPIPITSAAGSPGAVRRAASVGAGVLYDSLQTVERIRKLSDVYRAEGGRGARIGIRRVWIGPPPTENVASQMDFYRSYTTEETQSHWGEGQELVGGADGAEVAERLLAFAEAADCDALNLRVHVKDIEPERVAEQIARLGEETLPIVRAGLAARASQSASSATGATG